MMRLFSTSSTMSTVADRGKSDMGCLHNLSNRRNKHPGVDGFCDERVAPGRNSLLSVTREYIACHCYDPRALEEGVAAQRPGNPKAVVEFREREVEEYQIRTMGTGRLH